MTETGECNLQLDRETKQYKSSVTFITERLDGNHEFIFCLLSLNASLLLHRYTTLTLLVLTQAERHSCCSDYHYLH